MCVCVSERECVCVCVCNKMGKNWLYIKPVFGYFVCNKRGKNWFACFVVGFIVCFRPIVAPKLSTL